MKKKIIAHLSIILIIVGVFCNVCTNYNRISFYNSSVYAEADNWTSCDSSDLVTAFRYYCKSRNLVLNGSVADALTSFTTTTFNNLCSTLGIDPTTLQAELKKTTDDNLGLRFLFSQTGITAYNRIFAEFLQNNNLSVGDSVDNKVIQSGKWLQVTQNEGCYLFVISSASHSNNNATADGKYIKSNIVSYGSPYLKDNLLGTNNFSWSATFNNNTYSFSVAKSTNQYYPKDVNFTVYTPGGGTALYAKVVDGGYEGSNVRFNAYISYALLQSDNSIRCITYDTMSWNSYYTSYNNLSSRLCYVSDLTNPPEDTDITVNTPNNTVINNNTYNNNTYVIIYNDGDTYISDDDDEPLPTTPPSGGGGGGGNDNPDNPDTPDIPTVDPTPTPNPTIPDWDIELPEMPTGNDWLLYGLEKKFPWDIPFNLMYMLSLFAAEPETPHFEGTIDLKIVQWNYDIDLAPFDDIAGYVRNIEFIGFLIGLMLLTNKLIWG